MRLVLLSLVAIIALAQNPPLASRGATSAAAQDRSRRLLEDALKDGNPDVRTQAVQALGLVGPREPYISELEAMLDDKDVAVRLATVASLVDLRNPRLLKITKSGCKYIIVRPMSENIKLVMFSHRGAS
jgi:HEAT repeat protein